MKSSLNKEGILYNMFGSVRKIIALSLTLVFCCMSLMGKISQEQFIPVFSMVLGYYFGKSTALDIPKNHKLQSTNQEEHNFNEEIKS